MKPIVMFLLLWTLFSLSGCNKYPDGPFFSIYSAESRITGNWDLKYLYENGKDISGVLKNSTCNSKFHFIIEKETDIHYFFCDFKIIGTDTCDAGGSWSINNSKKKLTMGANHKSNSFPNLGPIFYNSSNDSDFAKWRITRLTFKDFWLTTTFKNKEYELIFTK